MPFEPIENEEEFQRRVDSIIKSRLERAERGFKEKNAEVFKKAEAYDELAEKDKSELQKALDRASEAEAKAKRLEGEAQKRTWADEISRETGVPARLLRGSTQEEMKTYAQDLADFAAHKKPEAPVVSSEGKRPSRTDGLTNAEIFAGIFEQ